MQTTLNQYYPISWNSMMNHGLASSEDSVSLDQELQQDHAGTEVTKDDDTTPASEIFRMFTGIICSSCDYLEFPGCDIHGLYTEMLPNGQAKCPSCSATTDNVKPFRDGCRQCKNRTTIHTMCCTLEEIRHAVTCFPPRESEIKHTALRCEHCASILFPSSRDSLISRQPNASFATRDGRKLNPSHFQRNMKHVTGCPRAGMPLKYLYIKLNKTELDFVLDRLSQCPAVHTMSTSPAYVARKKLRAPDEPNLVHQLYLQLLSTLIENYDYQKMTSETFLPVIEQIERMMRQSQIMITFRDWSPPRECPESLLSCALAFSSSDHSETHSAKKALETGKSYWRSGSAAAALIKREMTFLGVKFEAIVNISSMTIRWNKRYQAKHYLVQVSTDGLVYDTGINVQHEGSSYTKRVIFPQGTRASHVRIRMMASNATDHSFGVEQLVVFHHSDTMVFVSPIETLTNLEKCLTNAIVQSSSCPDIRVASMKALEGLALTSGSLCILLKLVYHFIPGQHHTKKDDTSNFSIDMSHNYKEDTVQFIQTLIQWIDSNIISQSFNKSDHQPTPATKKVLTNPSSLHHHGSSSSSAAAATSSLSELWEAASSSSNPLESLATHNQFFREAMQFATMSHFLDASNASSPPPSSSSSSRLPRELHAYASLSGGETTSHPPRSTRRMPIEIVNREIGMSSHGRHYPLSSSSRDLIQSSFQSAADDSEYESRSGRGRRHRRPEDDRHETGEETPVTQTQSKHIDKDDAKNASKSLFHAAFTRDHLMTCLSNESHVAMIISTILSDVAAWQMHEMQKTETSCEGKGEQFFPLDEPFSVQVCAETFALCNDLLMTILQSQLENLEQPPSSCLYDQLCREGAELTQSMSTLPSPASERVTRFSPVTIGKALLLIITVNLRRLVLSQVNPIEVGIYPIISTEVDKLGHDDDTKVKRTPEDNNDHATFESLLSTLEAIIMAGVKPTDTLYPLSLQAAAAIEVGMEALYPSAEARTKVLTSKMGTGATLEFQSRWPVAEDEHEDPRFERLLLLLQLECTKYQIVHALRGSWNRYAHLVIEIPESQETIDFLRKIMAECIQRAGFVAWQVVAGAQEISITLQRHLNWNRVEKMQQDSGAAWIRVYPREVASYDDVLTEVEAFVPSE